MHLKLWTATLILALLPLAMAKAETEGTKRESSGVAKSEYLFQAPADANVAHLIYNYGTAKPPLTVLASGTTGTETQTYSDFILSYERGIGADFSLGLWTDFGSDSTTDDIGGASATTKRTGLGDLHPFLKGIYSFESFELRYGAEVDMSLGKLKAGSSTADGNRYSGGYALSPYIAALVPLSNAFNVGGKLQAVFNFDKTIEGNPDLTLTGGNVLAISPFAEYNYGTGIVAAYVTYGSIASQTVKNNAGSLTIDSSSFFDAGVQWSHDFVEVFSLVANLNFDNRKFVGLGVFDSPTYTTTTFQIGGRFFF